MTNDEIIALVAKSLRGSACPSVNSVHQPDRYQASVTAEDLGRCLEKVGLIKNRHEFYDLAMPKRDSGETWNQHHSWSMEP